jgi:hypothetical protein
MRHSVPLHGLKAQSEYSKSRRRWLKAARETASVASSLTAKIFSVLAVIRLDLSSRAISELLNIAVVFINFFIVGINLLI